MKNQRLTYEELLHRLEKAEAALKAMHRKDEPSQAQADHIKQVLLAIHNVNQLIIHETDPKKLIERACIHLTETQGYHNAWIVLLDESGKFVSLAASSGISTDFGPLQDDLERDVFPECMKRTLKQEALVVIEDPLTECTDCPVAHDCADRAGLCCRLAFERTVFGIIAVSVPAASAGDAVEQKLFRELTAVLAVAFHKIELEQRRDTAECEIAEVLESNSDAFCVLNENMIVTCFNRPAQEIFGKPAVAVIGKPFFDVFPESWNSLFESKCHEALQAKKPIVFETRYKIPPYENWYEIRIYPRKNDLSIRFLVITERKQAEEALRASESKFWILLENMADWVWQVDREVNFTYVSSQAEKLLGYPVSEILGKTPFDFMEPAEATRVRAVFTKIFEKRERVIDLEEALVSRDGHLIFMETNGTPLFDENNEVIGYMGTCRDVTARRKADLALRESQQRFELFMEQLPGAAFIKNRENRILYCNTFFASIAGKTPAELLGKTTREYMPSEITAKFNAENAQVFESRRPLDIEHVFPGPDGDTSWLTRKFLVEREGTPALLGGISLDITERKKADEASRINEEKYHILFENMAQGAFYQRADAVLVECNPAVLKMFGLTRDEFLGKTSFCPAWKVIHEDGTDFPGAAHPSMRALRTGKPVHNVIAGFYNYKKKQYVWLNIDAVPQFRPGEDKPWQVFVTLHDITMRKQAEFFLKQERDRAQKYLDIAGVIFLTINARGEVTLINRKGQEVLGYTQEEIAGRNWFENFLPAKNRDETEKLFNRIMAGEFQTLEYNENPIINRMGEERIIAWHNTILTDDSGNIMGTLSSGNDITERKATEFALRESEKRLVAAQQIARMGDFTWDVASGEVTWSDALHELLQYEKTESFDYSRVNTQIHHPEDLERVTEWLNDCIASGTGELVPNEYRVIRKDGNILFIRTIGIIQRLEGKSPKIFATIQDITERRLAEDEKARLEQQFHQSQKLESIGRLAGGVAHDFNNMLSVILGHTEIALEHLTGDNPLFSDLEEIRKAAERSANLTRQLLAFARKQTIAPKVLDLNETVEGMLKMLRRLIGEDIKLTWSPGSELWPVRMDTSQIDQILANLCVNARDAIKVNGKIIINTRKVSFDITCCEEHPYFLPGNFVLLSVSDNGSGMDRETQENIFEPFFTTKRIDQGTGLGLATIYGIVKQNNGFINVYSEPGKGTTFKIYLPQHVVKTEESKKVDLAITVVAGDETILLVEDEPAILNMGCLMLERLGYRVLPAASPEEAIEVARKHLNEIHLLITDVVMPGMNGWDLSKKLTASFPRLRCLYMSGYTADVIAQHNVLDEGVHFIQKPFSMQDLATTVRKALERT